MTINAVCHISCASGTDDVHEFKQIHEKLGNVIFFPVDEKHLIIWFLVSIDLFVKSFEDL